MTKTIEATNYILESVDTKERFEDGAWTLDNPNSDKPSLIKAIYQKKQIDFKDSSYGIFRFSDWLPVKKFLKGSSATVTYKSEGLAKELGLSNLYISFSGYWPERNAKFRTCSFKETEAYSVCSRLDSTNNILVVASAGNTARAFARVCSDNNIPLLLCVPEDNLSALWFDEEINSNVKLIATKSGSDYFDAIHLSNIACELENFIAEGGAKNIARRDGMGTTVLSAVNEIGRIPDYYFQAVGSGTGAIAAWEANQRFIEDGRFGDNKMKLMVSQNTPFLPMFDAWKQDSRDLLPLDDDKARKQVEEIDAKVLSNRKPPYSIPGGMYDAIKDSKGDVLKATNQEALVAGKLFEKTEGIDIHPAAAVATASLIDYANNKLEDRDAIIMLNITGGGEEKMKNENKEKILYLEPSVVFDINEDKEEIKKKIADLF
ncbi:MAG: cysteate synthase [Marinifilaceae bacterium]|jgi:cysteate synthase|nr:cysteate synthase [Marinifilaceae bacterium]